MKKVFDITKTFCVTDMENFSLLLKEFHETTEIDPYCGKIKTYHIVITEVNDKGE